MMSELFKLKTFDKLFHLMGCGLTRKTYAVQYVDIHFYYLNNSVKY